MMTVGTANGDDDARLLLSPLSLPLSSFLLLVPLSSQFLRALCPSPVWRKTHFRGPDKDETIRAIHKRQSAYRRGEKRSLQRQFNLHHRRFFIVLRRAKASTQVASSTSLIRLVPLFSAKPFFLAPLRGGKEKHPILLAVQ